MYDNVAEFADSERLWMQVTQRLLCGWHRGQETSDMIIPYSPNLGEVSMLTHILRLSSPFCSPQNLLLLLSIYFSSCHPFALFLHLPQSHSSLLVLLSFYPPPPISTLFILPSRPFLPRLLSFLIYSSSIFPPLVPAEKSIRSVWCWNANLPHSYINQALPAHQKKKKRRRTPFFFVLKVEEQLSVL